MSDKSKMPHFVGYKGYPYKKHEPRKVVETWAWFEIVETRNQDVSVKTGLEPNQEYEGPVCDRRDGRKAAIALGHLHVDLEPSTERDNLLSVDLRGASNPPWVLDLDREEGRDAAARKLATGLGIELGPIAPSITLFEDADLEFWIVSPGTGRICEDDHYLVADEKWIKGEPEAKKATFVPGVDQTRDVRVVLALTLAVLEKAEQESSNQE